jgi:hypothetical protein
VGPRAGIEAAAERKIFGSCREWNPVVLHIPTAFFKGVGILKTLQQR